jgi:single-strand DNA-binding protein
MNVAMIRGTLSSDPQRRELPSGSAVVQYEVTTREPGGSASSVPVAWFDPPPTAPEVGSGTEVVVVGQVRRRFFSSGGATASRTEVVARAVVPASQKRRVGRLLADAVAEVA